MTQRWALVTGVGGGIGQATAAAFAESGWKVVGVDITEPGTTESIDRFEKVDLSNSAEISLLFDRVSSDLTGLDALVNNAAVQVNKPLIETTDAEWDLVMNTNVRSAFQCIRQAYPLLAAVKGSVVNVSSVHAVATSINVAAYAISKGALVALTRSTALELAADGIRCNAILPGAIDTNMLREGLTRRPHPDGADGNLRLLAERTPLGFVASADDIAPTIIHLADNEQSSYLTGQMVVIDGGATIRLSTE